VNKRYKILTTLDLMDGATSAGCGLAELLAGVASGGRRGQSAAAASGARLGLTRPGGIAGGAPSVADGTALVVGGGCGGSSEVEVKLGATDGVTPPATGRRHLPITVHRVCVVQLPASAVNAALPAFAAAAPCCCGAAAARGCVGQQSIDISCQPGARQQTRHTLLQRSIDGTGTRRTDTEPIDPVPHTARAVPITRSFPEQAETGMIGRQIKSTAVHWTPSESHLLRTAADRHAAVLVWSDPRSLVSQLSRQDQSVDQLFYTVS